MTTGPLLSFAQTTTFLNLSLNGGQSLICERLNCDRQFDEASGSVVLEMVYQSISAGIDLETCSAMITASISMGYIGQTMLFKNMGAQCLI